MGMISIAICDDEEDYINDIYEKFYGILNTAGMSALFDRFISPDNFKETLKQKYYDLVFLDIEMQPISGEEIAEDIMKNTSSTKIVFVTHHDEFAPIGYLYLPIAFIRKKFFDDDFELYKNTMIEKLKDIELYYIVENKTMPEKIRVADIRYISSDGNDIILYMADNSTKTQRKTLKSFADEVNSNAIIQINRSILVNVAHIKKVVGKYDIILDNEKTLNISRKYSAEFNERFFKYNFSRGKLKVNKN